MLKVFLSGICALALCSVIVGAEPVAHWKMDDGTGAVVKSSVAGVPDGKILNIANTAWVDGRKGGKALYFKGDPGKKKQGGAVRLETKKFFNHAKPFSITCWIMPESIAKMKREATYELISNTLGDLGPGLRLVYQWNQPVAATGDGKRGNRRDISAKASTYPVARSAWSHLAVTFDGKVVKLYVNGACAGSKETQIFKGRDWFFVGSYNGGYAYSFCGAISDVKFYDQELTAAQVMAEAKESERHKCHVIQSLLCCKCQGITFGNRHK